MRTLIIDNYDSFTYNLYQYIGELGGNPRVVRNDKIAMRDIKALGYSHIVISPGPGSPNDPAYFGVCRHVIEIFGAKIPLFGVCLGHQGIISVFGGKVSEAPVIRHGKQSVITHSGVGIFKDVKNPLIGMRYHSLVGERESFPANLEIIAESVDDHCIMGVVHTQFPIVGIQFHPESIGTEDGKKILKNFLSMSN